MQMNENTVTEKIIGAARPFDLKTLYIHGLDSFPVPQKMEILSSAGLAVEALHMNYRTDKDIYITLRNYALSKEIAFVVGSSLGGFLGFWLAEDLGLPCLLFNPAMSYRTILEPHLPDIPHRRCPSRYVVIGAHDDVVDPRANVGFFRKNARHDCRQRVVVCEWLKHQIDFDTFREMVHWALAGLKR
jgi:predicted esterase YcpF (UPF0227 family)